MRVAEPTGRIEPKLFTAYFYFDLFRHSPFAAATFGFDEEVAFAAGLFAGDGKDTQGFVAVTVPTFGPELVLGTEAGAHARLYPTLGTRFSFKVVAEAKGAGGSHLDRLTINGNFNFHRHVALNAGVILPVDFDFRTRPETEGRQGGR